MSEPFVFNPRDIRFKSPFGAVPCGSEVTLTCRLPLHETFTHCAAVFFCEFSGRCYETELPCIETEDEGDEGRVFSAAVPVPEQPDLVWYHFRFWRDNGSGCVLDKTGYRSDGNAESWQLTVYAPNHTPDWFGRGVTYQIFPDRFFRRSVPDPTGMVGDRLVHQNWDEQQVWQPDPDGEIRNRDFFGGSLPGITEKLDVLAELGVVTLYLCPIFESASNHRYNTADYRSIDPMLGTEEDLRNLCAEAEKRGMRVMLDGVFNHTGSQSLYFNADGFYPTLGAAQSRKSPYYDWFSFHPWPDSYDSWWGINTLPAVQENNPDYQDYIIHGEDSIIRHYLRCGVSGWRLDVADELPDSFIAAIRTVMEETKPGSFLLGEVWEDGSNKISYHRRRKYLLGSETHGLMNYPFRTAVLAYLGGGNAADFFHTMETIRENYPPDAFYSAMNFLGTHDTPRILTLLGASHTPPTRAERAEYRLSPAERARGMKKVRLATLILFTFPGSPMVYYGDEAGMEGFEDPFNRSTYPWGREDTALREYYVKLGQERRSHEALQTGTISYLAAEGSILAFSRSADDETLVTVVNAADESRTVTLPWGGHSAVDRLTGKAFPAKNGRLTLELPALTGLLLQER